MKRSLILPALVCGFVFYDFYTAGLWIDGIVAVSSIASFIGMIHLAIQLKKQKQL